MLTLLTKSSKSASSAVYPDVAAIRNQDSQVDAINKQFYKKYKQAL